MAGRAEGRLLALIALLCCLLPLFAQAEEEDTGSLRIAVLTPYHTDRCLFNFEVSLSSPDVNGVYGDLVFYKGKASFSLKEGGSVAVNGLPDGLFYTLFSTDTEKYLAQYYNIRGYSVSTARGRIRAGETSGIIVAEVYEGDGAETQVSLDLSGLIPDGTGVLAGEKGSAAEGETLAVTGFSGRSIAGPLRLCASDFTAYGSDGERTYRYVFQGMDEEGESSASRYRIELTVQLDMGESLSVDDDFFVWEAVLCRDGKGVAEESWEGSGPWKVAFSEKDGGYSATAAHTDTQLQLTGEMMLLGRAMDEGEFCFSVYEGTKIVATAVNTAEGRLIFTPVIYTEKDLGTHVYTVRQKAGDKADISYDIREYSIGVVVTKKSGEIYASQTGMTWAGSRVTSIWFENKYALTDFMVYNLWQGGNEGTIELILYADGEKIHPQPEYSVDGAAYLYENLPMFDSSGRKIVYSARELYFDEYMAMYVNTGEYAARTHMLYNGGTVINRKVTDFVFTMHFRGLDGVDPPEMRYTLYDNGKPYYTETQPVTDEYGRYVYKHLPFKNTGVAADYTVLAEPLPGYIISYENHGVYKGETGVLYTGGTVTVRRVPVTGDKAPFYRTTALLYTACLVALYTAYVCLRKRGDL